jgi:hypothetical protein
VLDVFSRDELLAGIAIGYPTDFHWSHPSPLFGHYLALCFICRECDIHMNFVSLCEQIWRPK